MGTLKRSIVIIGALALLAIIINSNGEFSPFVKESNSPEFFTVLPSTNPESQTSSKSNNPLAIKSDATSTQVVENDALQSIELQPNIICAVDCKRTAEQIQLPFTLSDEDFEKALGNADELAVLLQDDPTLRSEWGDLATHTEGNKRQVIIATFSLLEREDRLALGTALSESAHNHARLDGVHLLASSNTMDKPLAPIFYNILQSDQDQYVRAAAVAALNKPQLFYGDQDVLSVLEQVIYTDIDSGVRGAALLASTKLIEDPEELFSVSLEATVSDASEYQLSGVRALEEIMNRHTMDGHELSEQNEYELDQLMERLLLSENDQVSGEVRRALDDLYSRFY